MFSTMGFVTPRRQKGCLRPGNPSKLAHGCELKDDFRIGMEFISLRSSNFGHRFLCRCGGSVMYSFL